MSKNNSNITPDFLIIGASKSGTTALSSYLQQSNDIFVCEPKEPKYLTYSFLKNKYKGPGDDYTLKKCTKTFSEYLQLFTKAAKSNVKGEASVDMLYHHKDVIPVIKQVIGDPKIIIMLREPTSRAFSAYSHLLRDGREKESFKEGLSLEKERLKKGYEFIWAYKNEGLYYESVKSYLENFSKVKVIIFEEFIQNEQETILDVFSFLEVNTHFKIKRALQNKSGKPKSRYIHNFFLKDSVIKDLFKRMLGQNFKNRIKNFVQSRNLEKIEKDAQIINILKESYRDEIIKLSKLLDRNFTIWNK